MSPLRQDRFEKNEDGVLFERIFVIFDDEERSLLIISTHMEKGSKDVAVFGEMMRSIELRPRTG